MLLYNTQTYKHPGRTEKPDNATSQHIETPINRIYSCLRSQLIRYLWVHINHSMNQVLNDFITLLVASILDLAEFGFGVFVCFFFGFLVSA